MSLYLQLLTFAFLFLLTKISCVNLLKTVQLCPQIFEVDLLQYISPTAVSALCSNDVDLDEPIRIYNLTSQTNKSI